MYITAVLSHLGAWSKLEHEYPAEFAEIREAVEQIQVEGVVVRRRVKKMQRDSFGGLTSKVESVENLVYSTDKIANCLEIYFSEHKWRHEVLESHLFTSVKGVKNDIGIEWSFGKYAFTESDIFVKYPLFVRAGKLKLAIILMPVKLLRGNLPHRSPISSFETVRDRIMPLQPFPLKYPFVIVGIGDQPVDQENVTEMTSDLDQYLIEVAGLSLTEMKFQAEKAAYDFKEQLPEDTAKHICAFANTPKGGLLLVGVDDDGNLRGIPATSLDNEQRRAYQIATNTCRPPVQIDCNHFAVPDQPGQRILVIRVHELVQKPCMVNDRIYIRRGASASPATPDEVRQIILGANTMVRLG